MLLRPYQEAAINDACKALDKHKNTIVVAPTGAGKTIMLSALVGERFKKGQRVLVATIYPTIPLSDEDLFIYPKDGERLDSVAYKQYGDPSLWWVIAQANGLGKGRTILNPNFQIRIPGNISKIISDYNNLNS